MVAELAITMLACARLGVIHSQVFSGFSGKACADRIVDSQSRVLITMDSYYRSGNPQDQKEKADIAALDAAAQGHAVEKVLIWQRHPGKYSSAHAAVTGRDHVVNDLLKDYRGRRIAPEQMPAEAPLFLMYTSGTTGKPKGCQHSTGGYLAYVAGTSKYIQDIHPEDVYWCMADIGWITGHSYIVYGPLALGASSVIFEGVPTYPDAGRPWRIAEELDVNIFHTSPTAIRALRRAGPDEPNNYNYHFKHMTTVGEPIEPEVWRWYHSVVGKGEAVIVDTWWQTENGGFLCSTVPALGAMKPGSAGPAVPGIHPVIYDDDGNEIPMGAGRAGNICIQNPWPGIFQTIWGDPDRFVAQYYARYCKDKTSKDWRDWPYFAGDGAVQAADGYYRILGRIDDVINVAGHRLGTKEIEIGGSDRARGRRSGGGAGRRCHQGPGARSLCRAENRPAGEPGTAQENIRCDRHGNRPDRAPGACLDRARHAENPVGQDHAPGAGGNLGRPGRGRCVNPRQPRDRRGTAPDDNALTRPKPLSRNAGEGGKQGEPGEGV